MAIRLFIADDHAVFRSGLKVFLEKEGGLKIVGEAGNSQEMLDCIGELDVDILILDIRMPGPPVGQVITGVLERKPDVGIVVLSMHEDEWHLKEVLKAGAKAFVLKKSTANELVKAIRTVHEGTAYIDPALTNFLVSPFVPQSPNSESLSPLTKREEEVLKLLALGHTNDEIAKQLFISRRTVESHRDRLMEKIGVKTRAEIVRYAMDKGLLQMD